MYFPYLRGKQFELIALREISQFVKNRNLISPIIEPVKETTLTLVKTLDCLISEKLNFNLVINPQVGDIKSFEEIIYILNKIKAKYYNFQPALIINEKTSFASLSEIVLENSLQNICLICNGIPNDEIGLTEFIKSSSIKYIVINDFIFSKRLLREIRRTTIDKVSFSDPFNLMNRNVDYIEKDNEFFSDEHLFYAEENLVGFSDFLTIGQNYTDGGFLPYAVAIHLTYQNSKDEFWIRHFVSDSNEDTTDVAGKFAEALTKLVDFINKEKLDTYACREFKELLRAEKYPGLGSVKKLSIKHHIELVYNYLNSQL